MRAILYFLLVTVVVSIIVFCGAGFLYGTLDITQWPERKELLIIVGALIVFLVTQL